MLNYTNQLQLKMDISSYETNNTQALFEIQRAQRLLDETQFKIKKFKKEKQSATKPTSYIEYRISPIPDIQQYLSFLINGTDPQQTKSQQNEDKEKEKNAQYNQGQIKKLKNKEANFDKSKKDSEPNNLGRLRISHEEIEFYDIKKHTQQQLEKSQLMRLEKIQTIYKEEFEILDKKIQELNSNREKIKKDKVLLLRDNEEIQLKIEELRRKRDLTEQNLPAQQIFNQLSEQYSNLRAKLDKIEQQNRKIIKRKQQLQLNMRVCIKNSKEFLEKDLAKTVIRQSKSKSLLAHKCPYH